jgi:hypothetical protein
MRKMDDILVNLFDFTPDLVTGLQMQLDSFTGVLLENAENGLSGHAGTDSSTINPRRNKQRFMSNMFCPITLRLTSK